MPKPRVFLDANVFFSAFYGSVNCQKIIVAYQEGVIQAVTSQQVVEESLRNLQDKVPAVISSFKDLLTSNPPELIADPSDIDQKIKLLVDEKDQPIFTSAILGEVKYFVTGNTKDFKIKELEIATGIKVLKPKEFLDLMKIK